MTQNIERTEGQPGMSVKVPPSIVSPEVTRHIVEAMPSLGFEARMVDREAGTPVVIFEALGARTVFTNVVNAAIDGKSDDARIQRVDSFVAQRIAQTSGNEK